MFLWSLRINSFTQIESSISLLLQISMSITKKSDNISFWVFFIPQDGLLDIKMKIFLFRIVTFVCAYNKIGWIVLHKLRPLVDKIDANKKIIIVSPSFFLMIFLYLIIKYFLYLRMEIKTYKWKYLSLYLQMLLSHRQKGANTYHFVRMLNNGIRFLYVLFLRIYGLTQIKSFYKSMGTNIHVDKIKKKWPKFLFEYFLFLSIDC